MRRMLTSAPMGTYIYCISHTQPFEDGHTFNARAIGGPDHPARLLRYNNLVAVVSDVPAQRLDIKRDYLLAHEAVILETMERSDVIPLSFGTIARGDREVIEKLLKAAFEELNQQFEVIQGCVECNLKVLWNQERLFDEIVAENDRIRVLRRSIANAPINERIDLGQLTGEAIAWKSDQARQTVLEELEPLAVDTRLNRLLNDMMAMNAAFLVEKTRQETFDRRVEALAAAQEGRLLFRYTGPAPPYHFVDLSVSWEDAADGSTE